MSNMNIPEGGPQQRESIETPLKRAVETIQNQAKPILGVIFLVFAGLALWQGQLYFENQKELAAQEKIGLVLFELDKQLQEKDSPREGTEDEAQKDDTNWIEAALEKAAQANQVILEHLDRKVGQIAALQLADFYLEQKKPDEAKVLLEKALASAGRTSWMKPLLEKALSNSLIELGLYEEAFKVLEPINFELNQFMKLSVAMRKALLNQKLDRMDEAREELLRLSIDEADNAIGKQAAQILRLQKFKSRLKDEDASGAQSRAN